MQDFELELHPPNVDHSQTVKATFGGCSYSSKGCVNLPASTAVFRLIRTHLRELNPGSFHAAQNAKFHRPTVYIPLLQMLGYCFGIILDHTDEGCGFCPFSPHGVAIKGLCC